MSRDFTLTVDQVKLFDFLARAKDTDDAVRIVGSRIVTAMLTGEPDLGEMIVMELAGIDMRVGPVTPPAPPSALSQEGG